MILGKATSGEAVSERNPSQGFNSTKALKEREGFFVLPCFVLFLLFSLGLPKTHWVDHAGPGLTVLRL